MKASDLRTIDPRRLRRVGDVVYVVAVKGFLKAGTTYTLRERLRSIQWASPFEVKLVFIARGSLVTERAVKLRWRDFWSHGEWFRAHPLLLKDIAGGGLRRALKGAHRDPHGDEAEYRKVVRERRLRGGLAA